MMNRTSVDIPIKYFQKEYAIGQRMLDNWQRLDGWPKDYKSDFIKAILHGSDIPKIMEYTLRGDTECKLRILDGGHRTRAIHEFKTGDFPVKLSGTYYWWKLPDYTLPVRDGDGHNRELDHSLKNRFDNYSLTVTTYEDLTDEEARIKFNELNHCRPMNIAEVINSHSSVVVEFLRDEWDKIIKFPGSDDYAKASKLFNLNKKGLDNLNHMKIAVSLFSLIERSRKNDEFDYCEPAGALKYIRASDEGELNTQFSQDDFIVERGRYTLAYTQYENWYDDITSVSINSELWEDNEYRFSLANHSEALSYFHYVNVASAHGSAENIVKIFKFSRECNRFRNESGPLEKLIAKTDYNTSPDTYTTLKQTQKALYDGVGIHVVDWLKTFKTNGSGKSNLRKRYNILKELISNGDQEVSDIAVMFAPSSP